MFSPIGPLTREEFVLSRKPYDLIVVEEAAKISDIDLLQASVLGAGRTPHTSGTAIPVVLIGDEMQLPPHKGFDSNVELKEMYGMSTFHRYVTTHKDVDATGLMQYDKPITLRTQHRAHTSIAEVYSNFAYEGVVQTGMRSVSGSWVTRKLEELMRKAKDINFDSRPVSVISYSAKDHKDQIISNGGGIGNENECDLIYSIVHQLRGISQNFLNRILILTPYKAQAQLIRKALENEYLSGTTVSTGDAAQGMESDIVILSLTRTRETARNAFFDNRNRANVMLSRARERLSIIAAEAAVQFSPTWKEIFSISQEMAVEERDAPSSSRMDEGSEPGEATVGIYPRTSRFRIGALHFKFHM